MSRLTDTVDRRKACARMSNVHAGSSTKILYLPPPTTGRVRTCQRVDAVGRGRRSVDVAPDGGQMEDGQWPGQADDQVRSLGGRVAGAAAAQRARLAPQVFRIDVGDRHAGASVAGVRARGPTGRRLGQLRLGHAQRVHLHGLAEPPAQPLAQPQQPAVALQRVVVQVQAACKQSNSQDPFGTPTLRNTSRFDIPPHSGCYPRAISPSPEFRVVSVRAIRLLKTFFFISTWRACKVTESER